MDDGRDIREVKRDGLWKGYQRSEERWIMEGISE